MKIKEAVRQFAPMVAARAKEPSTLAGLGGLLALLGMHVDMGVLSTGAEVVGGIASLAAMALADPKAPAPGGQG